MKLELNTPAKVKAFAKRVQKSYKKLYDLELHNITFQEWEKEQNELESELMEAQRTLPKGLCIGKMVYFGVADGSATYLITKIGKRISKVEHVPFGDGYNSSAVDVDGSILTNNLRIRE